MTEADRSAWDGFVLAHPLGELFHLSGWAVATRRALRHECPCLLAESGGVIRGVLPLALVKSPVFGRALLGTGFTVGGGVLATDEVARDALLAAAEDLARTHAADRIELRSAAPRRAGWVAKEGLYFGFSKPLDPDPDRNHAALRRKQRAMVRKGLGAGLSIRLDPDVGRFYDLYAESVHRLGTPVPARAWFEALHELFADRVEVFMVEHEGRPVSGVLSFCFKGSVMPYYAGSTLAARDLAAQDVMYDQLMRHAVTRHGCTMFDFGRSKAGTGPFEFKRHWGFEPEPLAYAFYLPDGGPPPEINPLNPRYQKMVRAWQRLPPMVARVIGPPIARQLG